MQQPRYDNNECLLTICAKWDTMAEHVIKTEKQIPFEIHNKFIERLLARFVLTSDEKVIAINE